MLSARGRTVGEALICADGYADGTIGTNQDPCVFSAARITGVPDGAQTDAYRYNLSDAERGGMHCCTSLDEYRVIIGATSDDPGALDLLSTSFVSLAQRSLDGRSWCPAWVTSEHFKSEEWVAIQHFIDASKSSGPTISDTPPAARRSTRRRPTPTTPS